MHEYDAVMGVALDEARAALAHDDVPVGAVVVRRADGEVLARRHNERELVGEVPPIHRRVDGDDVGPRAVPPRRGRRGPRQAFTPCRFTEQALVDETERAVHVADPAVVVARPQDHGDVGPSDPVTDADRSGRHARQQRFQLGVVVAVDRIPAVGRTIAVARSGGSSG